MLLRFRVRGFKNLEDVTVRFGPLTSFVGPNGVGKSNLFDALQFLKLLAEYDIQEASARVRRPMQGAHNPRDLFLNADPAGRIVLEADFVAPPRVKDDFDREGRPSTTLLKYRVAFRYTSSPSPRIELDEESLTHHKKGDARALIGFDHSRAFRDSIVRGVRRGGPLISTLSADGHREIKLHQDGGSRGQPFPPGRSPYTVLGGTNTYEFPTVLAARREMASWHFLHLEPSAMRSPDPLGAAHSVSEHGAGMAATVAWLQRPENAVVPDVAREIVNHVKSLNASVTDLRVDRDEAREQLVLAVKTRGLDRWLGPRSLSDGTLRFLALAIMRMDPATGSMLCMEEPENGMHPSRVPALVELLRSYAVDPDLEVDRDNPLRQVVLNTHSPDVVRRLFDEEILFVESARQGSSTYAQIKHVHGTWRTEGPSVPSARVAAYIGGTPLGPRWSEEDQLQLAFGTAG
jgi:predicted ATPase